MKKVYKTIQFEFSTDAASRIQSLKERTSVQTYGEVIRDALQHYEWMHEVDKSGLDIAAIKDGKIVRVVKLLYKYTPEDACNYAMRTAGNVKRGWNQRFIDALHDAGYRLQPIEYRDPRPPDSIDAPLPLEGSEEIEIGVSMICPGGWHYPSIIVPVTTFDR